MKTTNISQILLSSIDENDEHYVKTLLRRMSENERSELMASVTRIIKWIGEIEEEFEENGV